MKDQQSTLWELRVCGLENQSRFGWEFQFQRPAGTSLANSRDADYVRFGTEGKDGEWLDSWFGATAASVDASEKLYLESKLFSERFVALPDFGIVGIDSRGVSTNGRHWRWLGLNYAREVNNGKSLLGRHPEWRWPLMIATHMIHYENATDTEASELRKYIRPAAQKVGIQNRFGWHTFRHTYSALLRSVGTEFKVMQELLRHSSLRSTLDVYTQAITPAKHAAQAAVVSLVLSSDGSGGSPSIASGIASA
jgi:hypothetical protein